MPIPNSVLLSGQQRKLLEKVWDKLTSIEQTELLNLFKSQEQELKDTLIEFCQTHPHLIKIFKNIRRNRKINLFQTAEKRDSENINTLLEKLLTDL